MKVTEDMIKGEIAGFPIEIVQRMVDCQAEQGNKADVGVFVKSCCCHQINGGFSWHNTVEKLQFWNRVISHRDFNLFFERYSKQNTSSIKHRFKIPDGCSVTVEDGFIVIEKS